MKSYTSGIRKIMSPAGPTGLAWLGRTQFFAMAHKCGYRLASWNGKIYALILDDSLQHFDTGLTLDDFAFGSDDG